MKKEEEFIAANHTKGQHHDQMLIEGFLAVIREAVTDLEGVSVERLEARLQKRQEEIKAENHDSLSDTQSRVHLNLAALVVAAYEMLLEHMNQNKAYALVEQALITPFYETVREGTRTGLDYAEDPFELLRNIGLSLENDYFGEGFTFEHEADNGEMFLQNVTRCFYHDLFVKNGRPELTPIFCKSDAAWIDGIDSEKHGVRFERPTTLGYGHDKCQFHFFRVSER